MRLLPSAALTLLLLAVPTAAEAAPTTSKGQISVAQVVEMASRAGTDANARMTLIAYLAGVGETTGLMVSEAQQRGAKPVRCTNSFNLDENVALAALTVAAPDRERWSETPATPIIVADMFRRAGCE
ncbi:chlorophyllide reductase [Devosia lacusdianchii]|jgi:hypothetical protein|uniref:chlorophyllide reductase n=1 Tax=Devosia lacusdianchii TaxID=2917991 RepID=UPI001F06FB87|nr:chlorophyllide reductase [Devosia sp. JXJ CY 41]